MSRESLALSPRMRPETVLAPQLRASLRVLQMDRLSLADEVRHEAEVNPVVELDEPNAMSTVSEEMSAEAHREASVEMPDREDESNPSVNVDEDAAERRQRFFDRQVAVESLQEHLLAQIGADGFSAADRELAELIVGDVDEDGRFVGSLEELADVMSVPVSRLDAVLRRIQEFDPPGVAGRNLRECLEIQIRQLAEPPPMRARLSAIVRGHLDTVATGEIAKLAKALDAAQEDCEAALRILRTLEPKPGRPYLAHGQHPQYIRPELEVRPGEDGLKLVSCERDLPSVEISPYYRNMMDSADTAPETRQYLRERIGAAERLQEAIHRRGETIMRVAEAVFSVQRDFFDRGFEALRPLTIEEIAHRTGYHGTTVGRAVRGKYVRTPRGVFELRKFFCVGHVSGGADAISAVAVKCRLADLVKSEGERPLTDEELADMLSKAGLRISRRTVAKYRAEIGVPPAAKRRTRRMNHEHA